MKIDANTHAMAHFWKVVNADTGDQIHNAIWADTDARQCCVYVIGPSGRIQLDHDGEPMTKTLNANVRLEWVGAPDVPMALRLMLR